LTLREIITAGEQLQVSPQLRRFVRRHGIAMLCNQYGPTETHVASEWRLPGPPESWADLSSIGRAIAGGRLYLLDRYGALVPDGLVGEIHIGGLLPARGYHGQPLGLRDIHPAVFGLPVVKICLGDPVLSGQIGRLGPSLVLLQHRNDLLFRKPCSLHPSVLRQAGL
jgi:acyl-coenzyme A synthetase/AMP-(fatty) acid ligase